MTRKRTPWYALPALMAVLMVPASRAVAQTTGIGGDSAASGPAVDTTTKHSYDIPADDLGKAVKKFEAQSNIRIRYREGLLDGLRSAALTGEHNAAEGLRILLEGTGIIARFSGKGAVYLQPEAQVLGTIVTSGAAAAYRPKMTSSATKTATLLRDIPQAITVVSKDFIADLGIRGLGEITAYIPGITMGQGEGNRDQPTIRGNATTAGFYVDGVRDDMQYLRDLYNVEQVDGIKGANALIFGRGTGGGVINRVTKRADWGTTREISLQGGSYGRKRAAVDLGQGLDGMVAVRLNSVYENSGLFRDHVDVERYGINPNVSIAAGARTIVNLGYEHFSDHRTADRGVPSFNGRPVSPSPETFFGDPWASNSEISANLGTASVDHSLGQGTILRTRLAASRYHKFYQNVFPGAVTELGDQVNLSAYNNRSDRTNYFDQTEVVHGLTTGSVRQLLLAGIEIGRQRTENFRNTGYFGDSVTSILVDFGQPTVAAPVTFRQSATDADGRTVVTTYSGYLQDQVAISSKLDVIAGIRFERFSLEYHNNRDGLTSKRRDDLVSPRGGLIVKPIRLLSLYGSYGVSQLPSSGDQFGSLNVTAETLKPEKFENAEVGVKWDGLAQLSLTAAIYQLDRTNTRSPHPTDPAIVLQTGGQRTRGIELGFNGPVTAAWRIAGGVARQEATITSKTTAADAGAKVALVPATTLSLWNRYQFTTRLGVGIGLIHQDKMFAAIDNSVTIPSFTRFDGAIYYGLDRRMRLQLNAENLFNKRYYLTAQSNNNISPGAPRSLRFSLISDL